MQDFLNDKVLPPVMDFVTSKPVSAIKDGMIATISLTLIGSIFLLLANFPYDPIKLFFVEIGLQGHMMQVYRASFNILAVVAAFSIAYQYAKHAGKDGLGAGILSVVVFFTLIPHTQVVSGVAEVSQEAVKITVANVLPMSYTGSKGLIAALIVGVLVGMVYDFFLTKGYTIKMPEGVPPNIAHSFSALTPGAVVFTVAFLVNAVFVNFFSTTFVDWVYVTIQTPLSGVTGSLGGVMILAFMVSMLWWLGVHGASLVGGITSSIATANMLANQAILDSGLALTAENGAAIMTTQMDALWRITGSGITFGVVIAMLMARSKQFKTLGKLALPPALFNINEPILFGTPIVLNPFLFIPFIIVPVVAAAGSYLAIASGLVPYYGGITVPWTTPPIISGFITGGWRAALLQLVIIVWSIVGYYPFIKKMDQDNVKLEQEAEAAHHAE